MKTTVHMLRVLVLLALLLSCGRAQAQVNTGGGSVSLPTTLSAQGAYQVTTVACGAVPNCYQVAGDVRVTADCATTNLSPTVTSATAAFTLSDVGKKLFCINRTNGAAVQRGTVLSVQSATSLTSSANSSATCAGTCTLELGTDDAPQFKAAYLAAIAANKGIALPCGIFLLDSNAPVFDTTNNSLYSEHFSISGCSGGGSNSTTFILGPDLLDSTGVLLADMTYTGGPTFPIWAHGASEIVQDLQVTGLSYLSSANYQIMLGARAHNLRIFDTNSSNASGCLDIKGGGESYYDRLNLQTSNGGLQTNTCSGVLIDGSVTPAQGQSVVRDSILAFLSGYGVTCNTNGFSCSLDDVYMLNVGSVSNDMVQCFLSTVCNIHGGYYSVLSGAPLPFADFSVGNNSPQNILNLDDVHVNQGNQASFVFNSTGGPIHVHNSAFYGLTASTVFSSNVSYTFTNGGGNFLGVLPTTNLPTFVVTSSEAGTGTCSANAATITFKGSYLAAPIVTISPNTSASTGDQITAATTTTATVHCNGATDAFNFTVTPNPF